VTTITTPLAMPPRAVAPPWLRTGCPVVYVTESGFAYPATVTGVRNGEVVAQPSWGAQEQRFPLARVHTDGAVTAADGRSLLAAHTPAARAHQRVIDAQAVAVVANRAHAAAGRPARDVGGCA
jgi:hypothetical protein